MSCARTEAASWCSRPLSQANAAYLSSTPHFCNRHTLTVFCAPQVYPCHRSTFKPFHAFAAAYGCATTREGQRHNILLQSAFNNISISASESFAQLGRRCEICQQQPHIINAKESHEPSANNTTHSPQMPKSVCLRHRGSSNN